jgi:hypothetical protein
MCAFCGHVVDSDTGGGEGHQCSPHYLRPSSRSVLYLCRCTPNRELKQTTHGLTSLVAEQWVLTCAAGDECDECGATLMGTTPN